MSNLTSSVSRFINTVTDQQTGEQIILPTLETLSIPATPNYVGGVRKNINSYGTVDIHDWTGSDNELVHYIGADFKADKTPCYRKLTVIENGIATDKFIEVPNNFFVERTDNHVVLGNNVTETYSIFDFEEAIYYYLSILERLREKGYEVSPAYAKVWEGGAKLFLQHKIGGGQIMGEPVDSYLSLITSHDRSSGFTLALSAVRLFCANQIQRMLGHASMKLNLRHTTGNALKIENEAQKMMELQQGNQAALAEYAESLAGIKVSTQNMFDAFAKMRNLEKLTTQRQVDNWSYLAGNLMAAYNMPDIDNFRGTALGAYYAASDAFQHIEPLRQSATRDQKMIEASLDGNIVLGEYTDILVDIAR